MLTETLTGVSFDRYLYCFTKHTLRAFSQLKNTIIDRLFCLIVIMIKNLSCEIMSVGVHVKVSRVELDPTVQEPLPQGTHPKGHDLAGSGGGHPLVHIVLHQQEEVGRPASFFLKIYFT